ncbi:MAG: nitrogen fixation protein NifH [Anaerolineales bacterium]|nr:nitrogen fixation protein NifH [Anaerolineales bacterium]
MSSWKTLLNDDPLPWLLEKDPENPGVRYFALRDLLGADEEDPEVREAQKDIMETGPVPVILEAQDQEGWWYKPGGGYSPKNQGTVWQILILAELGADPSDERVRHGCEYLLSHSIAPSDAFSALKKPVNSGMILCLNGNMIYALSRLGFGKDVRVRGAMDWMVRAITGEGDISYLKSGTTGPGFACSANLAQPCGWGANKTLRALLSIPPEERSAEQQRALGVGAEFLLGRDPAQADYPCTDRVSSTWFKFGFPLSYWSDVLETTAVLVEMGYGDDPRLKNAIEYILGKQDDQGRWKMENTLNRMWVPIEEKKVPSKWVTLRALRVLNQLHPVEL